MPAGLRREKPIQYTFPPG